MVYAVSSASLMQKKLFYVSDTGPAHRVPTTPHWGGAEPSMPAAKASVAADENAVL